MQVRLITKTVGLDEYEGKSIDEIIVGIARLSSSRDVNTLFDEPHKIIRHCLMHGHWSIFATCNLGFEIKTSRAIGRELLRHWSLAPQEFSQRYKPVSDFEQIELRVQSTNNRQSSQDIFDPIIMMEHLDSGVMVPEAASVAVTSHVEATKSLYSLLLGAGVARESARFILPESAMTTLYFNGKVRDWIAVLNLRLHKAAQKECRLVAEAIRDIFISECPIISRMLYNFEDALDCHILDRMILEKFGVWGMVKANDFKALKP